MACLNGLETMAALRKTDLITLARAWGYRCNQWRRRRACSRATHRVLQDLEHKSGGGTGVASRSAGGGGPAAALAGTRRGGGGATMPAPDSLELGSLSDATVEAVASYLQRTLQPVKMLGVTLLRGEEARESAIANGWTFITEASCVAVHTTAARLLANEPERQHIRASIIALQSEFRAVPGQPAWPAMAGRMSGDSLLLPEWLRRIQQLLDGSVAVIDAAAAQNRQAAMPAPAAWLDELRRSRVASLQLILRLQTLLYNTMWSRLDLFLHTCLLVCDFTTDYVHKAAESLQHRERWMRELMQWGTQGDDGKEARDMAAAASTLLFVSPYCAEQQILQQQREGFLPSVPGESRTSARGTQNRSTAPSGGRK